MNKLEELAFKLNEHVTNTGARFATEYLAETETLRISCDVDPDTETFVVISDEQILSVTHLFDVDEANNQTKEELYKAMLRLSPIVPLSSIGLQDDSCILFGAMPVGTVFENIAHELECQAENTAEVLDALSDFLINKDLTQEVN